MSAFENSSSVFADSKPHYNLLDGLRGVAALLVVWYHVFEGFQYASGAPTITVVNHGYLAVDFFFILSGFVIGYAYDDRLGKTLTLGAFFKRRLIRLHPMVIMGAVIGLVTFVAQGSVQWDGTHVALSAVMLALLCAMFFIPAVPGCAYEVRGNGEMFPLNGPAWSLFFEYIGNILYALFLHRLSTKALAALATLLGVALAWFTITDPAGYGMFGVGWTIDTLNLCGGLIRMLFPFTMGILLSRLFSRIKVRGAFWWCSLVLLVVFHVPYINKVSSLNVNGMYEAFCIIVLFPVLVWIAASGETTDKWSGRVCNLLGDLSFPLYIVHYPFMYLFYSWLIEKHAYTLAEAWPMAFLTCLVSVLVAWLCLRFYDLPVRRWLAAKLSIKR